MLTAAWFLLVFAVLCLGLWGYHVWKAAVSRMLWVLLIVLLPSTAFAQGLTGWDTAFLVTLPVYGYEAVKDARTTTTCVQASRCVEVNPVWAGIARTDGIKRSMSWKLAAQAGLAGGLGYGMHRWPEKKPYFVAALVTMTVLQAVVNSHNARVINR